MVEPESNLDFSPSLSLELPTTAACIKSRKCTSFINSAFSFSEIFNVKFVDGVLGSENLGLRRLTREKISVSAKIPIAVQTESLNVSNAAAIALYVIQNN